MPRRNVCIETVGCSWFLPDFSKNTWAAITMSDEKCKGKEGGRFGPVTSSLPVSSPGCMALRHKQPLLFPQGPPGSSLIPWPHCTLQIQHSGSNNYALRSMLGAGDTRLVKHSFCPQKIWSLLRTTHSRVWWGQVGPHGSDPSLHLILSSASFNFSHSGEIPDMFSPVTAEAAASTLCVCFCLSWVTHEREGMGKLKGSVLFTVSIVSTCQISQVQKGHMFIGRKGKAPERLGTQPASIWEGQKFLHQKQHKLGGRKWRRQGNYSWKEEEVEKE